MGRKKSKAKHVATSTDHHNEGSSSVESSTTTSTLKPAPSCTSSPSILKSSHFSTGTADASAAMASVATTTSAPAVLSAEKPKGVSFGANVNAATAKPATNTALTFLSSERLPTHSLDRFQMLSELENHAHSTCFLTVLEEERGIELSESREGQEEEETCEGNPQGDSEQQQQQQRQDTSETPEEIETVEETSSSDDPKISPSLTKVSPTLVPADFPPPYCLLYILWKPTDEEDPQKFCETVLLKAVTRFQNLCCFEEGVDAEKLKTAAAAPEEADDLRKFPFLYLVVDRVVPPSTEPAVQPTPAQQQALLKEFQKHHTAAEKLARTVASHPVLRKACDGITVGVSNHTRAAPGLLACLAACAAGRHNRLQMIQQLHLVHRKKKTPMSHKSFIAMVADRPGDFLGLQAQDFTARVSGVLQSKCTAEWNGKGNLNSFAVRAHGCWRVAAGLPPLDPSMAVKASRRKIPRRINNYINPRIVHSRWGPTALAHSKNRQQLQFRSNNNSNMKKTKGELDGFDPRTMQRSFFQERLPDLLGFAIVLFYIAFNFPEAVQIISWMLDCKKWDAIVQAVRSL